MAAIIRASYAISFNLLNSDGYSVLGIFDKQKGQTSTLEIINSSRRNLRLKNLNATAASADKHHFELKFRPGTLNAETLDQITADAGAAKWVISKAPTPDGCISFYLLSTNPGLLESGNVTTLKLNKLNADSRGGARGTKVELKWKAGSLEYVADATAPQEDLVAGHRVKHMDIVSQRGEQHIPLHVGFVGTNQVLNNGTANALTLRITNVLKAGEASISLVPPKQEDQSTEFVFSFENSNKEWTLGTVTAITMESKAPGKEFKVTPDPQASPPVWTLIPEKLITLAPGDSVDIKINNVRTTSQPGPATLTLHYKNIPGYWDGDFVCVIEKSPLVYASTGVGIGVTEPKAQLDVKGQVRSERLSAFVPDKTGKGSVTPSDGLHVVGDTLLGALPSQIKCVDDDHRLIFDNDYLELKERKNIVFSPGSNVSDATKKTPHHVMLANGNVGIGVENPEKHLHVAGAGDQEIMIQSTDADGGLKWTLQSSAQESGGRFEIINRSAMRNCLTILKDGKVGIGTVDPKAKLEINGDLRVENVEMGDVKMGSAQLPKDKEIFFADNGQIRSADNAHRILFRREENKLELREWGDIVFSPGSQSPHEGKQTAKVVMFADGTVSMGMGGNPVIETRSKPRAILDVNGYVVTNIEKGYHYLNYDKSGLDHNFKTEGYGIFATARIAASEFNAVSDARIKNIQGRSDGATDLSTLLGIEVVDYTYRDVIGKGSGAYKKLIGQQVERVFPQAVSKGRDVAPDIYQPAPIHDGWVSLATDLKKGERVKLITDNCEGLYEVVEVTDDKFRVDFKQDDEKVFVFGREVDDFRTVDYDAISMLNVSATQQIKKEMDQELKALRLENAELRAANDALARRLQLLESKMEAVMGVMSAANGSNGNGRH
jgi:hypothetical protein